MRLNKPKETVEELSKRKRKRSLSAMDISSDGKPLPLFKATFADTFRI
jgi:hypothetical protein